MIGALARLAYDQTSITHSSALPLLHAGLGALDASLDALAAALDNFDVDTDRIAHTKLGNPLLEPFAFELVDNVRH